MQQRRSMMKVDPVLLQAYERVQVQVDILQIPSRAGLSFSHSLTPPSFMISVLVSSEPHRVLTLPFHAETLPSHEEPLQSLHR